MDDRGNYLSSCKMSGQYLENKSYQALRTLTAFVLNNILKILEKRIKE